MEKNTILAVVLCSVVLIVSMIYQMSRRPAVQPQAVQPQSEVTAVDTEPVQTQAQAQTQAQVTVQQEVTSVEAEDDQNSAQETQIQLERVTIETELVTVVLTNSGGDMVSYKLKEHVDNEDYVDMIFSGANEAHAFSIAFGGLDAQPVTALFHVNRISEYSVEFYRDFSAPVSMGGGRFRLIKRYDFKPKDFMFELTVTLDGGFSTENFNFAGSAYTLSFGPQIGPKFEKLDNRYDFRQYFIFTNGKRKNAKVNDIIDSRPAWAAIAGKYFTFIAIPYLAQYSVNFSDKAEPGLSTVSRFNIIRPAISVSKAADTYRFYLGPKTQEALTVYNTGRNEFGIKDTGLIDVTSNSFRILSPLEKLLKWLLLLFYKIVPNYGVAIILLTLFIKILFYPLTKKGSEATFRMQALAPKIKELQNKYKDNPQKMNTEMAKFYQQEGYNPLSGCLPMLLQLPIFLAMYNLFNNHFDLRGAMFIPGWIPDLSVPEAIVNFPENFQLPILKWTALRGLPFIYVGSQLLYGKVTQNPGQQTNSQMKMMLYVMPIAFFFILYNVPSGLLIYWIFSNLLTLVQQLMINKYVLAKKVQTPEPEPVIAPKKKRKKTF